MGEVNLNDKELLQYVTKEIKRKCDVDINYTFNGHDYLVKYISPNYLRNFNMSGILVIPQEKCCDRLALESNNLETNDLEETLKGLQKRLLN